jgi:ATP-dependent DNA ligase
VRCVLDAEIVWPTGETRVGRQQCRDRVEAARELLYGAPEISLAWQAQTGVRPEFHVFDCLAVDDQDLMALNVLERRAVAADCVARLGESSLRLTPSIQSTLQVCRDQALRWMAEGYEGAVLKPLTRGYSWQGSRVRSGWVKVKKSVDWRARNECQMLEVDAWVAAVRDGRVALNMLIEASDDAGRCFPCRVGEADLDGRPEPEIQSVWRVDAAYYDHKIAAFRYLRLMEHRPDKRPTDCRVGPDFPSAMALRVCNF